MQRLKKEDGEMRLKGEDIEMRLKEEDSEIENSEIETPTKRQKTKCTKTLMIPNLAPPLELLDLLNDIVVQW
jgi:hypothetical protein